MFLSMLLMLSWIQVNAMYRNELRHLPEKLRQERIQLTLASKVKTITERVIQAASTNHTDYSFTLFCLEPNIAQSGSSDSLYQPYGDKYILLPNSMGPLKDPILPRPRCEAKYGYELYQTWSLYNNREYNTDRTRYNEMLQSVWPIEPLEDSPSVYIQRFFDRFNQVFPDIHLDISWQRPSHGVGNIFDQECCPVYNVSW